MGIVGTYRHIRSGDRYRVLLHSFSVERQRPSIVYMSLHTGEVFDRDIEMFQRNFEFIDSPQDKIKPRQHLERA